MIVTSVPAAPSSLWRTEATSATTRMTRANGLADSLGVETPRSGEPEFSGGAEAGA
jgi:hypothetical protein